MNSNDDTPQQVLDPEAIDALRELQAEGEPDVLLELVEMFEADSEERLAMLRAAVTEERAADVERAAHGLVGGSAVFGAEAMIAVCRQLQLAGQSDDLVHAPQLVERLQQEYARVLTALRQELEQGR